MIASYQAAEQPTLPTPCPGKSPMKLRIGTEDSPPIAPATASRNAGSAWAWNHGLPFQDAGAPDRDPAAGNSAAGAH